MLSRAIPSTSRASPWANRFIYSSPSGFISASSWKGKQRETLRYTSSSSRRPVYAHEDLLSTSSTNPPRSSPSPSSPSSRRSSSRKQPPPSFFSQSYLTTPPISVSANDEPPLSPPSTSPLVPLQSPLPKPLPPSLLSNGLPNPQVRWRPRPQTSIGQDVELYKQLGKFKLSSLVVLTTMAGYAMCPVDPSVTSAAVDAFAQSLSTSTLSSTPTSTSLLSSLGSSPANNLTLSVLLPTTVGTTLCAFSAASFNQLIESPYDAQMARTRSRPLPKRLVTPLHSFFYGTLTGSLGLTTLYFINPLSSFLGLFTIILYCPLYTISKRHTIYNTWIGSIVGALPPLIGWAACTDSLDPWTQPGAWSLFFLMFFWQFPHFMSLAHTLRSSYASSGYRMLSVLNPPQNALVGLRYSLALIPLCFTFPYLGLTNGWFAGLSLLPNGLMTVCAWRFWKKREERRAKELFWSSLISLPVVLVLMLACKKGLWGDDNQVEDEEGKEKAVDQEKGKLVVAV
ncbi:hypothetical protein JCM3765_001502 [Sporobolomyces pararoseus]